MASSRASRVAMPVVLLNVLTDTQFTTVIQTPKPDHIVARVTLSQSDANGNLNLARQWTNVVVAPPQKRRFFIR